MYSILTDLLLKSADNIIKTVLPTHTIFFSSRTYTIYSKIIYMRAIKLSI